MIRVGDLTNEIGQELQPLISVLLHAMKAVVLTAGPAETKDLAVSLVNLHFPTSCPSAFAP